jgi:hypothetical protein
MDYVTRQFINLTKKLRKDLQKTLQEQTNAIRNATKATRENKQQPLPVPLPVLAELQLPEAEKRERRTQYDKNHTVQVWLAVGTWLTFLAAAIYGAIAYSQEQQLKRQVDAYIEGQSAQVVVENFNPDYSPDNKKPGTFQIVNRGISVATHVYSLTGSGGAAPHGEAVLRNRG